MKRTMREMEIVLEASFDELATWESNGLAVYGTPSADHAYAMQVYIGNRPNFLYDFVLATVQDFLEAEGLDTLGWQDMTEEELHEHASETLSCTVSRIKQVEA